jgi:hypothetical protein
MHALAKGAARASGLCHYVGIFICRVLCSPEGARLRAIGNHLSALSSTKKSS